MVLLDTSVWIRYFADVRPLSAKVDRLLDADLVVAHELVYGELLITDPGGRKKFLATYELMPRIPMITHDEVVALVRGRGLHGRGVGWIDTHLLASALASQAQIWTADHRFAAVAKDLGITHST